MSSNDVNQTWDANLGEQINTSYLLFHVPVYSRLLPAFYAKTLIQFCFTAFAAA